MQKCFWFHKLAKTNRGEEAHGGEISNTRRMNMSVCEQKGWRGKYTVEVCSNLNRAKQNIALLHLHHQQWLKNPLYPQNKQRPPQFPVFNKVPIRDVFTDNVFFYILCSPCFSPNTSNFQTGLQSGLNSKSTWTKTTHFFKLHEFYIVKNMDRTVQVNVCIKWNQFSASFVF